MRLIIIFGVFLLFVPLAGFLTSEFSPTLLLAGSIGVAIFLVSFVNIEIGLYILIFSMLLSPEFIAGETTEMTSGRGVTLRYEDFLLVIIGASWFAKTAIFKELGLFLRTRLNTPILLYVLACVIATGFGIMMGRVSAKTGFFFVLKYIEYFIVFFMMVNHVENTGQIKRFVFFLFLTCFIVSVVGMLQIPGGGRVSAPFEGARGEPNTFGGYLLFLGAIAVGLFAWSESKITRRNLVILILCIIPPFLFTQSRASYLAVFPVMITLAWFSEKRLIYIALMIFFLIVSPFLLPSAVKERVIYTFTQEEHVDQVEVGGVRLDTSTSARLVSWKEAMIDWVQHPILGYGVTGYRFMDAQYPRVIVETGIIGFIAFMYLLYSIGKMAIDHFTQLRDPFFKGISYGFFAGFVGLLVHAIGANTFIIVRIMEPFWFFAGIVAVLPALEKEQLESDIA